MKFRLYFDVVLCSKFTSNLMRVCQLPQDIGVNMEVTMDTEENPTKEYIDKIVKVLESTKEQKELKHYYTGVKHIKTEVLS